MFQNESENTSYQEILHNRHHNKLGDLSVFWAIQNPILYLKKCFEKKQNKGLRFIDVTTANQLNP